MRTLSDSSASQGPNARGRRQAKRAANPLVQQSAVAHHREREQAARIALQEQTEAAASAFCREQAARIALQVQMESAAARLKRADQTITKQDRALEATARQRDHFQNRSRAACEEVASELRRANALERALERSDADRRAAHSKLDTHSTAGQTALTAVLENPSRLMST